MSGRQRKAFIDLQSCLNVSSWIHLILLIKLIQYKIGKTRINGLMFNVQQCAFINTVEFIHGDETLLENSKNYGSGKMNESNLLEVLVLLQTNFHSIRHISIFTAISNVLIISQVGILICLPLGPWWCPMPVSLSAWPGEETNHDVRLTTLDNCKLFVSCVPFCSLWI